MQLQKRHWTIFSILILTGCSSSVERPDTDLCVINAPLNQMKCYNLKRDYDSNGVIKPEATGKLYPVEGVEDVNKFICTSPEDFANLKSYIKALREEHNE